MIEEINNRIDEIDDTMQDLRNERYELEKKLMVEQQEKLKCLVGLCVVRGSEVFKVINVPQEDKMSVGFHFNPYQIPVVRLGKTTITKMTLFSRAVDAEDPKEQFLKEHQTCSKGHFEKRLMNIVERLNNI